MVNSMLKELKLLKIFFEEPNREVSVREYAKLQKISPATASKLLKNFTKNGILKEKKQRIFNFYAANLDDERYRDLKVYYNIRKIKESGIIEAINKFYMKPLILLFGSFAFGTDTETSDVDLLIISEKTKEFQDLKIFEKRIGRRIQIFVFKDIKDIKNRNLVNSMLNGIVIQGEIKWI